MSNYNHNRVKQPKFVKTEETKKQFAAECAEIAKTMPSVKITKSTGEQWDMTPKPYLKSSPSREWCFSNFTRILEKSNCIDLLKTFSCSDEIQQKGSYMIGVLELLIILHQHDIIKNDANLMILLKARIEQITVENVPYYNVCMLIGDDIPKSHFTKNNIDMIQQMRKQISSTVNVHEIVKLLCDNGGSSIMLRPYMRTIPISREDCKSYFSHTSRICDSLIARSNSNIWLELYMSIFDVDMIAHIFELCKYGRSEILKTFRENLQNILNWLRDHEQFQITTEKVKIMIDYIIKNLDYNLLGGFNVKYYHLYDECVPIYNSDSDYKMQEFAQIIMHQIEDNDCTSIINRSISISEVITPKLHYGVIGLNGMHAHCFGQQPKIYEERIFKMIKTENCNVANFLEKISEYLSKNEENKQQIYNILVKSLMKNILTTLQELQNQYEMAQINGDAVRFEDIFGIFRFNQVFKFLTSTNKFVKQLCEIKKQPKLTTLFI